MMPGVPEQRSHDYVRHGTTDLFAALKIADGKVISLYPHHRDAEFMKFLERVDKAMSAGPRCTWSATYADLAIMPTCGGREV